MPQLLEDYLSEIVRRRNGPDMRQVSHIKFALALAKVMNLDEEKITENVVCPNYIQNMVVVSTLIEKDAKAYASISSVAVGSVEYQVNAYMPAPDDTCKEVLQGADLGIDLARI
ncbi:hypothetical protein HPB51_028390 [Rhipicephalus microplus]|uniref:Uncharacterized protein n=1 Tax=Rhipicephalus microplus TaxID=6941 RepID=A0A9J6CXG1_RHIMP|nr:hypothetical protein HPB51_028390 [Rhipicephalus microplus]